MDLRRISAWIALRVFWTAFILAAALALWARPVPACEVCVEDHPEGATSGEVLRTVNGGLGGSGLTLVALKVIS
jgi:hypothetical protein